MTSATTVMTGATAFDGSDRAERTGRAHPGADTGHAGAGYALRTATADDLGGARP